MATHPTSHIEKHPDLVQLRERYAQASAKPASSGAEGLLLLAGLYLAISPWVVGFQTNEPIRVNNLITGIALAVLAVGFQSVLERTHGLAWAACAISVYTIIAPWAVSGTASTTKPITSNAIVGGVATALCLVTMGMGLMGRMRRGAFMRGEPVGEPRREP